MFSIEAATSPIGDAQIHRITKCTFA